MSVLAMPTRICLSAFSSMLFGTASMFFGEAAYSNDNTSRPFTVSKSCIPEAEMQVNLFYWSLKIIGFFECFTNQLWGA